MAAFAAAHARSRLPPATEPNVIPFIDVLLVLLIIFMVTAPKPTTDLRLDLPSGGVRAIPAIPPTIVEIREDRAGYRLFVSGAETSLERLGESTLQHMLGANPALAHEDALAEGRVYVRADLDVAYQSVVSAADTLQTAGFEKVSIVAQYAGEG